MKIKEFARKYGFPYFVVYKASFLTYPSGRDEREYDERELFVAVAKWTKRRLRDIGEEYAMYAEIARKLREERRKSNEFHAEAAAGQGDAEPWRE